MKPSNPDGLLDSNPSQPPLDRGGARVALPLSRGSWRGLGFSGQSCLIAALLLISIPTATADNLGRLFFTPAQRAQLDYAHARSTPAEGSTSPFLTVNGIVQKSGGARTVWVNGVAQSADNSRESNPTAQTVTIPGKTQPVKIKVGDRILLDQSAPPGQPASAE